MGYGMCKGCLEGGGGLLGGRRLGGGEGRFGEEMDVDERVGAGRGRGQGFGRGDGDGGAVVCGIVMGREGFLELDASVVSRGRREGGRGCNAGLSLGDAWLWWWWWECGGGMKLQD